MTPTASALPTDQAKVLRGILDWIDSVPQDLPLPGMPGFDREWMECFIYGYMDDLPPLTFPEAVSMALEWVDAVPKHFLAELAPFDRPSL